MDFHRAHDGLRRSLPPSITALVSWSSRLRATLVGVTLLLAVGALYPRPVCRLGAIAASVAELVAVATLNLGHVARLCALLRHVALAIAVATLDDAHLLTVLSTVALFTTIVAEIWLTVGTLAREMPH